MPAPWPPAWWHPNIDGHHRFTRGILRGRGKGCSQETRGKPELKGESKTKGVKAKRVELDLNGSMRIGQRSTEQEKERSPQRGRGPGSLGGPGTRWGRRARGSGRARPTSFPATQEGAPPTTAPETETSSLPRPPSFCPGPHRFNWKAGAPLGWGIPGPSRGAPRGSSWSGVGVGESPKAPSTVTPAGDRSVSGCWLSSCLRAPCCPEGLRRFWLRSQLVHRKGRGSLTHLSPHPEPAGLVTSSLP